MMDYRPIGATSLTTSAIGFGTWPIGGARYGATDDADAMRAIAAAINHGITCFDTAPSYGNGHAEEVLGRALAGWRDQVQIVTKGGLVWNNQSEVLGRDSSAACLSARLDDSLQRLQTDYVDLFLIHWPDPDTPLPAVAAALEELVAAGKTRAIGVSNFRGDQVREISQALTTAPLAINQVSFSLFDRRWANDAFAACRDGGVSAMAYGPLAHGLLTGTFSRTTRFDPSDWRAKGNLFGQALLTPDNIERNLVVVDRLREIADRKGTTLPRLAIAWVLQQEPVAVALVGARNEAEIKDSVRAVEVRLSEPELAEIERVMGDAAGQSTDLLP